MPALPQRRLLDLSFGIHLWWIFPIPTVYFAITGSPTVRINNRPASRIFDFSVSPFGVNFALQSSYRTYISYRTAHRVTEYCQPIPLFCAWTVTGSYNTYVG